MSRRSGGSDICVSGLGKKIKTASKIEIRKATEDDIPEIIGVLQKSLGDTLVSKTEVFWKWKHVNNPFGKSPVLVATDGNKIVAVRAFMRWEWKDPQRQYLALRAVDTATLPEYQGQGLFRKLTTQLVEICQKDGYDFIFNTPNQKSMPGYLKMGWQRAGRLPVYSHIRRLFGVFLSMAGLIKKEGATIQSDWESLWRVPGISELVNVYPFENSLSTNVSVDYLRWRYQQVPVAKYFYLTNDGAPKLLIIGREKRSRFGREMRLCDIFLSPQTQKQTTGAQVTERLQHYYPNVCTASALRQNPFCKWSSFRIKGPWVTYRDLNFMGKNTLHNFKKWAPSLGDLELM